MGFDFARGRLDRSTHPFTTMVNEDDVRLTIRAFPHEPTSAVFATLHEGGHALYDQGLPRALHGTLLADGPSSGMHESQARLWENHVGRSRAFWEHFLPRLAKVFPGALAGSRRAQRAARDHRGGSVAEPRRGGRGHVQPAHPRALRARARAARRRARRGRAAGRVERALRAVSRRHAAERAHRLPAGRALGARRVRLFPDLHDRQLVRGAARRSVRARARSRRAAARGRPASRCAPGCSAASTRTARSCRRRTSSRPRRANGSTRSRSSGGSSSASRSTTTDGFRGAAPIWVTFAELNFGRPRPINRPVFRSNPAYGRRRSRTTVERSISRAPAGLRAAGARLDVAREGAAGRGGQAHDGRHGSEPCARRRARLGRRRAARQGFGVGDRRGRELRRAPAAHPRDHRLTTWCSRPTFRRCSEGSFAPSAACRDSPRLRPR